MVDVQVQRRKHSAGVQMLCDVLNNLGGSLVLKGRSQRKRRERSCSLSSSDWRTSKFGERGE